MQFVINKSNVDYWECNMSNVISQSECRYFYVSVITNLMQKCFGKFHNQSSHKRSHNLETLKWIHGNMMHYHRLCYCWIMERFLVCYPNIRGNRTQKVIPKQCKASVSLLPIGLSQREGRCLWENLCEEKQKVLYKNKR